MIRSLSHISLLQYRGAPTLIVLVLASLYVTAVLINAGGDPHVFVLYDGHYFYQIAHRWFESPEAISQLPSDYAFRENVPTAYRYQRIVYPVAARLLSFGQPQLIPWMLILVNITAIGLGTWATERILIYLDTSPWYALAYGFYGGNFIALRANMAEPLAYALVLLAILAWLRQRQSWSVLLFALAVLTRETTVLFVVGYCLYYLISRQWHRAGVLATAVLPYFFFQMVLYFWLGETGFRGNDPFILLPLGGWLMIASMNLTVFLLLSLMIVPISIIPLFAALVLSVRDLWRRFYHPFVFILLIHALFLLFLPHLTFREASAMTRVTQGLAANMVLYGALTKSPRILNYSLLWIATNALLVKGA
jgi:hypothetical protein